MYRRPLVLTTRQSLARLDTRMCCSCITITKDMTQPCLIWIVALISIKTYNTEKNKGGSDD